MVEVATQRIVPGAPPPAPLSKAQKKRRKAKGKPADALVDSSTAIPDSIPAAVIEKAPATSDIIDGALAAESVAQPETKPLQLSEEPLLKPSPIVDLVHKRLKATTKKISRISVYASTDPEKLNDDQKRTLKTLPSLEAVQKELGEVKKAVEAHESELAHENALKQAVVEKAERARIADAVSAAERSSAAKIVALLDLLRFRSLLASGDLDTASLDLDQTELAAIVSAAEILVGEDGESRRTVLHGFLSGHGEFERTTYSRLLGISHHSLYPPSAPTPIEGDESEETQGVAISVSTLNTEPDATITGVTSAIPTQGSFHFMQASELEAPSFEDSAEWVERAEVVGHEEEVISDGPGAADIGEKTVNGLENLEESVIADYPTEGEVSKSGTGALDWADEEGGLPSIAGLQAKFGTSGSATPVGDLTEETQQPATPVNGHAEGAFGYEEDDGFTQARGGRGRGRGFRGGDRDRRGGFRGGDRGFRGGYDRSFRRGGDRSAGDRGSGYRSRGEWRGDGENRGRGGRGRGRGDKGGSHPPTSA